MVGEKGVTAHALQVKVFRLNVMTTGTDRRIDSQHTVDEG